LLRITSAGWASIQAVRQSGCTASRAAAQGMQAGAVCGCAYVAGKGVGRDSEAGKILASEWRVDSACCWASKVTA
jgi:hypothetical protein